MDGLKAGYGAGSLLALVVAVLAGALTWGTLWSGFVVLLRRRGTGKWWNVGVKALTGLLMLYFAARSLQELLAG